MKNQSRIPGVDTFRFCAFINVFLFHATTQWSAGYLGVQLFFVLSSFLLTYLALNEINSTGHFSRFSFFLRRAVRIYPLYFMVVAVSFYVLPVIAGSIGRTVSLPESKWMYWTFLSNFDSQDHIFALKFLWSISVEEQFYILFIALSFFFKKNIYIPVAALVLLSFGSPYISHIAGVSDYHNPLTYFADFGIGMLAAKLYFDRHALLNNINLLIASLFSGGVVMVSFWFPAFDRIFNASFAVFAASFLLLIIYVLQQKRYRRLLPSFTEFLGRYTYGLYVYSGFVLTFAGLLVSTSNGYLLVLIEFSILLVISVISYHIFEKRFLELKDVLYYNRWNRGKASVAVPSMELAPATISL
jgi:peptidoglycan/LPS O-acetylase OafA/YrhL